MATIGTFAGVTFSVSDKTVKTFNNMKWQVSGKYAEHDRHLKRDLLEFLGPELETISFEMRLSVFLGVTPLTEIIKLRSIIQTGKTDRLVIGGKVYGSYKWALTEMSVNLE
ncbi:MAG: phage tail protein, partial [Oscillospiraceae bacterium]|nr:phage tail protein [Oscillospiraceae bacterium]